MCYAIIAGLSHPAQERWLDKLPAGLRSWAAYEELAPAMGNLSTVVIVKGMCACGLFNRASYEATIKKYHRKGWSEARIERTLADISKNRNPFGLDGSLRLWLGDVADDTGGVYFFIHWISNSLETGAKATFSAEQIRDMKTDIPEERIIYVAGKTSTKGPHFD